MLLFLFLFLLHYDTFICYGTNAAKFNESLLVDKLYKNLLQVNTVLEEVQKIKHNTSEPKEKNYNHGLRKAKESDYDRIRNLKTIKTQKKNWNPKSQNHLSPNLRVSPKPTISNRRQGFSRRFPPSVASIRPPFLLVRRPPPGYRMAIVPIKPGPKLKRPGFLLQPKNPGLDPSQILSDYLLQNAYLQPSVPFLPDVYKLRPKELNQSVLDAELDYFHEEQPNIFNLSHFLWPPHLSDDAEAGTSQTQTTPYIYTRLTNENGEHIWLTEVYSSYAPEHSSEMTYHHYHPESGTSQTLTTPYPDTHPTNEKEELTWPTDVYSPYFPEHSNEMTVVATTPYSSFISTESTPRIINLPDYNTHYNTETTPTSSASSPYLFWEDEHGYLYLTVPQKGETTVPAPSYSETLESTATTAGDVFYGKITVHPPAPQSPLQRYLELVERLDEGYMLVFLLELCRLVAVKQQRAVRQALYHTESAYNHWWNNGRLFWIEEPLQTVIWKLVVLLSDGDIEVIQTYASMMFHTLLRRRETLSPEVNSILDRANVYYSDEEGQELFKALMEFENYPNITKSSYSLCDRLIASVLNPFRRRRPHLKLRRKKLMDSINAALNNRFPNIQTGSNEGYSKGEFELKKRKKHRRPYPHRMRKRKKYRIVRNYHNSILRTMSPMTREQTPMTNEQVPIPRELATVTREQLPLTGDQRPVARELALIARELASMKRDQASVIREQAAMGRELVPVKTEQASLIGEQASIARIQAPLTIEQTLITRRQVTFRAKRYRIKNRPATISFLSRPARAYSFNKRNRKLTHKKTMSFQEKLDAYFGRYRDRSSSRTGHYWSSTTEHRPSPTVITSSTGPVLHRSSYFGKKNEGGSKNTGHHHFLRKTSTAKHRPPPRVTTSSTSSEHLESSFYDRSSKNAGHHGLVRKTSGTGHRPLPRVTISSTSSYDKSSKNSGRHGLIRKTSTAKHRPPPKDTTSSTSSELPGSSSYDRNSKNNGHHHFLRKPSAPPKDTASSTSSELTRSNYPVHLKRPRISKKHYHHQKGTLKNSKRQKYVRENLRARLFRKESRFPTVVGSSDSLSGSS